MNRIAQLNRRSLNEFSLLLLLFFGLCLTASADNRIVFAAQYYKWVSQNTVQPRDKFSHLYLISPRGSQPIRLTSGKVDDTHPEWSPDHSQIAFSRSDPSGRETLCVISMPSHHISKIYRPGKQEIVDDYEWSPHGNLLGLICRIYHPDPAPEIGTFKVLEGAKLVLTSKNVNEFAWSPNGRQVYLSHGDASSEVLTLATHHSRPRPTLTNPVWLNTHVILGIRTLHPDAPALERRFYAVDTKTGRRKNYLLIIHHLEYDRDPFEPGTETAWFRSPAYQHGFALNVTYHMSDGDHDWLFTTLLGSSQGTAKSVPGYVQGLTFGGYSPHGSEFVCYSNEWVGDYKRGGEQLGPLEVRNLTGKQIRVLTSKMILIQGASWY